MKIVGLIVLVLSILPIETGAQEQAPAPSFKEGDTWQFKYTRKGATVGSSEILDGINELTISQGKLKLYEVIGNQKNEIPIMPDGPTQGVLTLIGKSEQQPNLKFPLSVGQKWSYEHQTRPAGVRRDITRFVEVNVTGMDQVTTPAGSFKAYKLVIIRSWSTGSGWGGNTSTYFYSPETRSVVKRITQSLNISDTTETELVKFTPGN